MPGSVPFGLRNELAAEDDFDRLFAFLNRPLSSLSSDAGFTGRSFHVDVKDNGASYELKAELPGLTKDDVSLSYKDNYLTIATKKEDVKEEKDEKGSYIRRECYNGSMSRSFYIDNIDESKCDATFKDGILTVTLPKAAAPKEEAPKQIPIHSIA